MTYERMFYDRTYEYLRCCSTLKIKVFLISKALISVLYIRKRETSLKRFILLSSSYMPYFMEIGELEAKIIGKFYIE